MSAENRVQVLSEAAFADWNRFVAASPDGSIYSTTEYLDALCTAVGGRFRILGRSLLGARTAGRLKRILGRAGR